mgnify:FL=1
MICSLAIQDKTFTTFKQPHLDQYQITLIGEAPNPFFSSKDSLHIKCEKCGNIENIKASTIQKRVKKGYGCLKCKT